ncbi:MAG: zinc ribbon domain-containing protein [Patescibacteria group bacterium]|nr:zinc ribbon domain-containing protein [Patescibacteria group bacterium]
MQTCAACGMPLLKKEDFALGDENSNFCLHCANPDGSLKTCEEIFQGGVEFFLESLGGSREMAEKITRKNMLSLPAWQGKDCEVLKGELASDEEFAAAMSKLA